MIFKEQVNFAENIEEILDTRCLKLSSILKLAGITPVKWHYIKSGKRKITKEDREIIFKLLQRKY